jgi:hypothetical protein
MGTLRALAGLLSNAGHQLVYVNAKEEQSGNEDFDGTIWGLTDEGVDDRFTGKTTKKLYLKFLFDNDVKESLVESGFPELSEKYAGAILTFNSEDTDIEPERIVYFQDSEDLAANYIDLENQEGGRLPEEDSEEDSEEIGDADGDGEVTFDDLIWTLVDEVGCDESIGEETDGIGWYGLFKFSDEDTKTRISDEGFGEEIANIGGAVVFYREGAEGEDNEESIDYYAIDDLQEAWNETKTKYEEAAKS